jgi:hypothetical protein
MTFTHNKMNKYLDENLYMLLGSMVIGLETVSKTSDMWLIDEMFTPECFVGESIPDISLTDYVIRCVKYFRCSPSCFVVTCIYIDRMRSYTDILVHSCNVHRIFLTALVIACKYIDDKVYKNSYYARCGGITRQILNEYEVRFLTFIHFDLTVETEMFEDYTRKMAKVPLP